MFGGLPPPIIPTSNPLLPNHSDVRNDPATKNTVSTRATTESTDSTSKTRTGVSSSSTANTQISNNIVQQKTKPEPSKQSKPK